MNEENSTNHTADPDGATVTPSRDALYTSSPAIYHLI